MRARLAWFRVCALVAFLVLPAGAAPVISNVSISQTSVSEGKVTITYDLGGDINPCAIGVLISKDGGVTYEVPKALDGAWGSAVSVGTGKTVVWYAGLEDAVPGVYQLKAKVIAWDLKQGDADFVWIPAGNYQVGNSKRDVDLSDAAIASVALSGFYIQSKDVTGNQWNVVQQWAKTAGYGDLTDGQWNGTNHPVHSVSWYEALRWANAASEKEGLKACYRLTDGSVLRSAAQDTEGVICDWAANGYRLPTEAEWEVAARGGKNGNRFPWGDGDWISSGRANYTGNTLAYAYDRGQDGPNGAFSSGAVPYTNPVGFFAANGYGLFDMAGNVAQWCWDRYNGVGIDGGSDPRGASTGVGRVVRGGSWDDEAGAARCARRDSRHPLSSANKVGFRLVRSRP